MNAVSGHASGPVRLAVDILCDNTPSPALQLSQALAAGDTLAVFGFGDHAPAPEQVIDARYLRVPLPPLQTDHVLEVWRGNGPVRHAREEGLSLSDDGQLQFGVLEVPESRWRDHGPDAILHASEHAYARLKAYWRQSAFPHLLRVWNYLDAITQGEQDLERYRQFCVGRVHGLGQVDVGTLPAATAIGSRDGQRVLQVYWLAARHPGFPLENPRQVSAYHYPRQYGPQSPSFARGLLPASGSHLPLFLSGTASIVGHASRHVDSLHAQLDETLANLHSVVAAARLQRPSLSPTLDASSRLKVYVRDAEDAPLVAAHLHEKLGPDVGFFMLLADVCRRELMVEIEGMHGVGG